MISKTSLAAIAAVAVVAAVAALGAAGAISAAAGGDNAANQLVGSWELTVNRGPQPTLSFAVRHTVRGSA
jgi:hypothetical protein